MLRYTHILQNPLAGFIVRFHNLVEAFIHGDILYALHKPGYMLLHYLCQWQAP